MRDLNFFTPVSFNDFNNQLGHYLLEVCDSLFSFYGDRAVVISPIASQKYYPVELKQTKLSFLETVFKIVCLMTVVIPLVAIIGKIVLRSFYDFKIKPQAPLTPPSPLPTRDLTENEIRKLLLAATNGDLKEVSRLLALGNITDKDREKVVLFAAGGGIFYTLNQNLKSQGMLILEEEKRNIIKDVAEKDRLAVIKKLLKNGSISGRDWGGAIIAAAGKGQLTVFQELLKNSTDISIEDRGRAVAAAAGKGKIEIIKELFKNGAKILDRHRKAAAVQAGMCGHFMFMRELMDGKCVILGESSRDIFSSAASNGFLGVIQELIKSGYQPSKKDRGTAVYNAAKTGHLDVVQELLKDGSEIMEEDREYAVMAAAAFGYLAVVQELLKDGAEISEKDRQKAIDIAKQNGHQTIVDFLNT